MFAPLWLLLTNSLFKSVYTEIDYVNIVFWICAAIAAFFLGICLRMRSENVAEAFLNWLTKPLLLLCGILYITLGLYTNTYLFLVFDLTSLLLMLAYSCTMYVIGFLFALLCQQPVALCRTIATHAAVPHCLLSLVVVRYSMNQPASDIASIAPIILLIFASIPFILELAYKVSRDWVRERLQKQEEVNEKLSRVNTQTSLQNGLQTTTTKNNDSSATTPVTTTDSPTTSMIASQATKSAAAVGHYDSIVVHQKITSV